MQWPAIYYNLFVCFLFNRVLTLGVPKIHQNADFIYTSRLQFRSFDKLFTKRAHLGFYCRPVSEGGYPGSCWGLLVFWDFLFPTNAVGHCDGVTVMTAAHIAAIIRNGFRIRRHQTIQHSSSWPKGHSAPRRT